jgi:hypothetical protein
MVVGYRDTTAGGKRAMRRMVAVLGVVALLGCAPTIPDSGAGVGFDSYTEYQRQRARLEGTRALGDRPAAPATAAPIAAPPVPPPPPAAPAAGAATGGAITTAELAAAGIGAAAARPNTPPPPAAPGAAAGPPPAAAPVIPPLPERTGSGGPNIAAFALATSHPVGQPMYRRSGLAGPQAAARACARFASPALAQEAFLARGGPERDPMGLDPDGDGYVCGWDPAPFRLVHGG